jgi:hypothetical protein
MVVNFCNTEDYNWQKFCQQAYVGPGLPRLYWLIQVGGGGALETFHITRLSVVYSVQYVRGAAFCSTSV